MEGVVTITYERDGWRFVWHPTLLGKVKIGSVPSSAHEYQMDPPDVVNLGKTDALGMHPDLPFMRILDNFRKACGEWVADMEEGR